MPECQLRLQRVPGIIDVPTYQYACTECGHRFEQFQSFSDDALTECPECAGRLRKLFNAVGVVFKGSGFYRTDSRAQGSSDATTSNGDAGTAAAKDGGSSNGETKGSKESSKGSSGTSDSKSTAGASSSSS